MKIHDNSQAVSESLGYIMIFGVVVACIAIMFVVGNHIISDNQATTSFKSMQQSFNVIQSNLMNTAAGSSPVKTTVFNVNGGMMGLSPGDEGSHAIVINYDGNEVKNLQLGEIRYNASATGSIALEDGAVISAFDWDTNNDSIMTKEPRMFYSSTTGTLMICTVNLVGTKSAVSSSYTALTLKSGDISAPSTFMATDTTNGAAVQLKIKTSFANAWKLYLSDIPGLISRVDASPDGWVYVTLGDKDRFASYGTYNGIKKLIIVSYDVQAALG